MLYNYIYSRRTVSTPYPMRIGNWSRISKKLSLLEHKHVLRIVNRKVPFPKHYCWSIRTKAFHFLFLNVARSWLVKVTDRCSSSYGFPNTICSSIPATKLPKAIDHFLLVTRENDRIRKLLWKLVRYTERRRRKAHAIWIFQSPVVWKRVDSPVITKQDNVIGISYSKISALWMFDSAF